MLGAEVEASLRLETGEVAQTLGRVADQEAAAVIVVGARDQGAIRTALLGSVSASLAAAAARPVIVVPPGAALSLQRPRAGVV